MNRKYLLFLSMIVLMTILTGCTLDPNNEPNGNNPKPPTELQPNPNP